jgi:hypothetical protein
MGKLSALTRTTARMYQACGGELPTMSKPRKRHNQSVASKSAFRLMLEKANKDKAKKARDEEEPEEEDEDTEEEDDEDKGKLNLPWLKKKG